MEQKEQVTKLNAEIPVQIKKELDIYCILQDKYIKDVVAIALEEYLERNKKVTV
jgi:hypothetical protein